MIWQAACVFAAFVVLDIVWALYTRAIARHWPVIAMATAAAIPALSGFVAIQYVENHWMLIPAALGGAVGTGIGMIKWKSADPKSDQP